MKRIVCLLAALLICVLFCGMAMAEVVKSDLPMDPFTWEQLATIAGATTATLLIVQLLKLPLDKVWKIPTRIIVYVIALIIMLVATGFTVGLTASNAGLAAINAVIVALAAMGAYEMTFRKLDNKKLAVPEESPEAAPETVEE